MCAANGRTGVKQSNKAETIRVCAIKLVYSIMHVMSSGNVYVLDKIATRPTNQIVTSMTSCHFRKGLYCPGGIELAFLQRLSSFDPFI